jgi:hypothetical protein
MTALFLLAADYRAAAEKLADLDLPPEVVADTLESLSGDLQVKAENVAHMVRSMEADASAVKQWAKDATDRAKVLEGRAESLRDYLQRCMEATGIERIEGPGIVLSFRKSSAVVIDEPGLVPSLFMRQPETPPPAPDKKLIADAIKAGKEVPGAHIEQRRSLQIK